MWLYTDIDDIKARIRRNLEAPYSFGYIHGSNDCCLENIAFSAGIGKDMIYDKEILDFYELYLRRFCAADDVTGSDFVRAIMLNCLLYMGKKLGRLDGELTGAFHERLQRVYGFSASGEDIYYTDEERKQHKSVPPVWKSAGIVRYEHTSPRLRLPVVYDLLGYSAMYGADKEADRRIDGVTEYVLGDRYQREVKNGYGIGINGEKGFVKSAYYSVGWDISLSRLSVRQVMLYMILLSNITSARKAEWYSASLSRLEAAVNTDDTALLSEATKSVRKTYWTSGCYLDFGRSSAEKKSGVIKAINELANQ